MDNFYKHLGLTDWPFTVVPRPEHCTFIAGRDLLRDDIASLLRALSRRDTSSIHTFWSSLGAGKTHSLFFLENEAKQLALTSSPIPPLPIYTEFPKGARSFKELYRAFAATMDINLLVNAFLEVITSPQGGQFQQNLLFTNPDLEAALRALVMDDGEKKAIAFRWLRGDVLPVNEFRKAGISQKIASTEQAMQVLSVLIRLLYDASRLRGNQGFRVVWLIDEFQRVDRTGRQVVLDVNAGLHSLFNAVPTGLTLIISFTGPPDSKRLPNYFSPELRDRIGASRVLILPPPSRK